MDDTIEISEPLTITFVDNEEQVDPKKHNHYFKDVSNLEYIDVYRVLKLFEVDDPCLQHAGKKILCAGLRGHKDLRRDVQDVIDSCTRFLEMYDEDQK